MRSPSIVYDEESDSYKCMSRWFESWDEADEYRQDVLNDEADRRYKEMVEILDADY